MMIPGGVPKHPTKDYQQALSLILTLTPALKAECGTMIDMHHKQ